MRRLQVNIVSLLAVVVVAALGFAAVRTGTSAWAGTLASLLFFTQISALLGVAFGRGSVN